MKNIEKESLIDKTIFMCMEDSVVLILDNELLLSDFESIEYNKKYLTFTFDNKERKLLIPKLKILKDMIERPNIYIVDRVNLYNKIFIIKNNHILV
jgi:tmRNA-binding protein